MRQLFYLQYQLIKHYSYVYSVSPAPQQRQLSWSDQDHSSRISGAPCQDHDGQGLPTVAPTRRGDAGQAHQQSGHVGKTIKYHHVYITLVSVATLFISFTQAYGESTREWLSKTVETFKASGGQFKTYSTSSEIMEDFPQLNLGSSPHVGLLDEEGGFMMAEKSLETTRKSAVSKGCKVMDAFEVKKLDVGSWGEGVSVKASDGRVVRAKGVVVCAGAWTNKVLEPLK